MRFFLIITLRSEQRKTETRIVWYDNHLAYLSWRNSHRLVHIDRDGLMCTLRKQRTHRSCVNKAIAREMCSRLCHSFMRLFFCSMLSSAICPHCNDRLWILFAKDTSLAIPNGSRHKHTHTHTKTPDLLHITICWFLCTPCAQKHGPQNRDEVIQINRIDYTQTWCSFLSSRLGIALSAIGRSRWFCNWICWADSWVHLVPCVIMRR